jgi:hypothetical protein
MSTAPAQHLTDAQARGDLCAYLSALADKALADSFIELRERHGQHMRRRFYPAAYPDRAASAILRIGRERDAYIGVAPRAGTRGGRDAIALLGCLWVDADSPEAIERLAGFTPAPSILIATGRGQHAYWLLDRPTDVDAGEHANRRLAHHLAADASCFDAARILRPPHTHNYRYQPPRAVRPLRLATHQRYALESVLGGVDDLPPERTPASQPPATCVKRPASNDPLLEIEPAVYVQALLGVAVGRDRKVSCPFHADEHPSLHVYPTAAQGWHCFSCRRGGSIYDLASDLLNLQTRGVEFLQLRAELGERLLRGRAA